MLVLIVIAAIVVVCAVVFLAMGRGGGMSAERNDYAPLDLGPVSATDVALLRPPTGLWGYNMQATDEAMERIAEAIRERDVRIVALEQLVTDLSRKDHAPMPVLGPPFMGARHRRDAAMDTEAVPVPQAFSATESAGSAVTAEADAVRTPADSATAESGWRSAGDAWRPDAQELSWRSAAGEAAGEEETNWSPVATQPAQSPQLPFEPPKPNGDASGAAPEESHD